ncbi:hypothetical protein LCGC14_2815430 [marine sediment metagenome]|uniref:Uncharacterized protein n=1 Tax=marine sediment metagenome TaxID=412755 RepID=A0A0F8YIM1_9ZZZZ
MVTHKERINQISIGLKNRQLEFFQRHPEFDKHKFIRNAIDEQIKLIDPEYLE